MADTSHYLEDYNDYFQTNVIVRNVGGKKLKIADTSRYSSSI